MKKAIPLTLVLLLAACGGSQAGSENAAGEGSGTMADSAAMAPAPGGMMNDTSGMGAMHDSAGSGMMQDTSGMGSMEQSPAGGGGAMADTSGMDRD